MADPDWNDPCAVLTWLRPQYYRLAAGGAEVKVKFFENETTYALADAGKLAALIAKLEQECAVKNGGRRRRAFRCG